METKENPADCATRGLSPQQLSNFELWWHGPKWLQEGNNNCRGFDSNEHEFAGEQLEAKPSKLITHTADMTESIVHRYSSFTKLARITAYILRFIRNSGTANPDQRYSGSLKTTEYQRSITCLVRLVQKDMFAWEYNLIKRGDQLPNRSKLSKLTPFLDDNGILRVLGRLQRTTFSYNRKHPAILAADHHFTRLIIDDAHHNTLHGGIQLTLETIRHRFWIIDARRTVQNHIRKCVKCFRNKPSTTQQLMGNLPNHRVNPPKRAFMATGVDFTGAFELRSSRFRGNTTYKGYIAVFICLATKAIHLEAVTGMTATHFLWAFQRFMGRRGICHDIYSDCGTSFRT